MVTGDVGVTARPGRRVFLAAVGIVAAMLVAGAVLAWRSFDSRRDDARGDLEESSMRAADAAEGFLMDRLAVLATVAGLPVVRSGNVSAMQPYLEQVATPELDLGGGVGYIDADGQLLAEANSAGPFPVDLNDRVYVREVLATNEPYVSEAITGRLSDNPIIVLATPVGGDTGAPSGIVIGSILVADIAAMMDPEDAATLGIIDRAGNLIYADKVAAEPAPPADPSALNLPTEETHASRGLGGESDQVVAVSQVPTAQWRVVLQNDKSAVDASARELLRSELVLLAAAVLVALAAAAVVARRIGALHAEALRQTHELAALERFTAALTVARTSTDVVDAVRDYGPPVVGAERMELAGSGVMESIDDGPLPAPTELHVVVSPAPGLQRHRSLVATIVDQAGQALERVRVTDEVNHLAELSAALARATTTEEVVAAVHDHGAVIDAVTTVTTALADDERGTIELYGDPTKPSVDHRAIVPFDAANPHAAAIRTGDMVSVDSPEELRAQFPEWADDAIASGAGAVVAAPFVLAGGTAIGSVALTFDRPGRLDQRTAALVSTITRLSVDALTRARLFEQEQRVADTLQASLKPARLPAIDGWRFTGVHLAGEAGSSVGGDWYDVAVLPHGSILLSVGDVTGRGPVAAGVMGLVRAAVHALALSDRDPASILDHTDRLLTSSTADQLATAWVGLLDPQTGRLHYASAGHLPPLALGPSGKHYLEEPPGLLLGTGLAGNRRSYVHDVELDGSIVAFTDGLCERRDESLDTALRKLSAALGDGTGVDARTVVRRAMGHKTSDDVVVLVGTRLARRP